MAGLAPLLPLAAVLFLAPAHARGAPGGTGSEPSSELELDPAIVGGQEAGTCQWPTAVALSNQIGLCTGTLVHPRVVLYAAHCGTDFSEVIFGEDAAASYRVPVERCARNSTADQVGPSDYAFCLLAESMEGVPLTPVVNGCEGEELTQGRQVAIAGFGEDDGGDFGVKRWAMTTISGFDGGMIMVGGGGVGAWMGDSGGPAYVQLADGGWRAFGIVSGGPGPGQAVYYVDMRTVVRWVEEQSAVDITPCFATGGQWQATPECGGFATAPTGSDTWTDDCGRNDPRSAPSTTCGAPFVSEENDPSVRILSPSDGTVIDQFPADITIEVDANDDTAVRAVRLAVDGEVLQERLTPPWEFSGTFPKGTYDLVALAQDVSGNDGQSDTATLYVGEEPSSCLCRAAPAGGPWWATPVLILAALAASRRRRRGRR